MTAGCQTNSWKNLNRSLSLDHPKMPPIEGQDAPAMPFSAFDDRGIGQTQWKVVISADKLEYAWPVTVIAVEGITTRDDILDEERQSLLSRPLLNEVGDLRDNCDGDDEPADFLFDDSHDRFVVLTARIESCDHRGGIKRDQSSFQFSASHSSKRSA